MRRASPMLVFCLLASGCVPQQSLDAQAYDPPPGHYSLDLSIPPAKSDAGAYAVAGSAGLYRPGPIEGGTIYIESNNATPYGAAEYFPTSQDYSKQCHTGPRGGRYYRSANGNKVYGRC